MFPVDMLKILLLDYGLVSRRSNKNKLPQEYIHQLEKLNFDWHPNDTGREKMFLALRTFKEKNGHCNVPKNYIPENPSLGAWVDKAAHITSEIINWH